MRKVIDKCEKCGTENGVMFYCDNCGKELESGVYFVATDPDKSKDGSFFEFCSLGCLQKLVANLEE